MGEGLLMGTKSFDCLVKSQLEENQFTDALNTLDKIEKEHYKVLTKSRVPTPFLPESYNNILSPKLFATLLTQSGTISKSEKDSMKKNIDSNNNMYEKEKKKVLWVKIVPPLEVSFGLDLNCFIHLIMSSNLRVRPRAQGKYAYSVSRQVRAIPLTASLKSLSIIFFYIFPGYLLTTETSSLG